MIAIQMVMIFVVPKFPWPLVIGLAYCFGGVINHSLSLGNAKAVSKWSSIVLQLLIIPFIPAIHEIAHNLAFGHARPKANRFFGMIANLPIGIPMSIAFKKYHLEHHRVRESCQSYLLLKKTKEFCKNLYNCFITIPPFSTKAMKKLIPTFRHSWKPNCSTPLSVKWSGWCSNRSFTHSAHLLSAPYRLARWKSSTSLSNWPLISPSSISWVSQKFYCCSIMLHLSRFTY